MSWKLIDARGEGTARLIESDGDWAVIEATHPYPIGATVRAVDASGTEYRIKVRGGKKVAEGCFRVEGRLQGMTREERAGLLAQLPSHG
ncbi:MAG: hypothetical protein RL685_3565 [Pseudomonadota bacterium]|jgi:hypothetical protein